MPRWFLHGVGEVQILPIFYTDERVSNGFSTPSTKKDYGNETDDIDGEDDEKKVTGTTDGDVDVDLDVDLDSIGKGNRNGDGSGSIFL